MAIIIKQPKKYIMGRRGKDFAVYDDDTVEVSTNATSFKDETAWGEKGFLKKFDTKGNVLSDAEVRDLLELPEECEIVCATLKKSVKYIPEGCDTLVFGKYAKEYYKDNRDIKYKKIIPFCSGKSECVEKWFVSWVNLFMCDFLKQYEADPHSKDFPLLGTADKHPFYQNETEGGNVEIFCLSKNVLLCKAEDVSCKNVRGETFDEDLARLLKKYPKGAIK